MTGNELKALAVNAYGDGWLNGLAVYLGITPRHVYNLVNEKNIHKKWERSVLGLKIAVENSAKTS